MGRETAGMSERIRILKYEPKIITTESKKLNDKPAIKWTANLRIEKYNNDESYESGIPDEIQEVKGNTATTKGLFTIWNLAMGKGVNDEVTYDGNTYTGVYPLNESYAWLGVGSGTTTPSASDTALDDSNAVFVQCDPGWPKIDSASPNTLQLRATFGAQVATMAWNEWGVANGDAGHTPVSPRDTNNIVLFNRKVENMGSKSDDATWVIIADLLISPSAS